MIISLAGVPGAGKSTVRNLLAEHLGMPAYSMGEVRRKMAEDRGLTIDQLNALGMTQDFTDKEADTFQTELAKKEDNFIMDSRLAWHFIPQSVKIFLDVDLDEAARRIFEDRKANPARANEAEYSSVQEVRLAVEKRLMSDDERYKKWYGVNYLDRTNYDLVIDTTHTPPEEVVQRIIAALPVQA